ncbi:MAG TPA: hypothetical protein VF281_04365 [Candidatus Saccharimonadales bacterium]
MKKLFRPSFAVLRRHKKLVILISIGLILIIFALYGLWSRQQWMQYQPSYTAQYQAVKTSFNKLTANPVVTDKDKETVLKQLTVTSESIDKTQAAMCTINTLVAWQESVIASLKQERQRCSEQQTKLVSLNQEVKRAVVFVNDDDVTAKLLKGLSQVDEVTDGAWQEQVNVWQAKSQAIEKITVSKDFKPVQQLAVQKTAAVATAWQGVIAAHAAKDKQKYVAAQAGLAAAYDGLDGIAVATAEIIETIAKAVEKDYQMAF